MEVEIPLFAGLRAGRFDKATVELAEGTCARDLFEHLNIPGRPDFLPLVNGWYARGDQLLADSHVVSIFPAIAGG